MIRPSVAGNPERIFFPGLNIVRFYAALAVIYQHFSESALIPGLSRFPNLLQPLDYIFPSGQHAVTLFFVLSGFLITYLLLSEHQRTQTIAVKKFYVRRMLRIWPLYYLIMLIAFFVLPYVVGFDHYVVTRRGLNISPLDPDIWTKFGLFVFMLPNVAYAVWQSAAVPAVHLWSIGVEEQFYLLWPLLVRKFVPRLGWLLYAIVLVKLLSMALLIYIITLPGDHRDSLLTIVYYFLRDWRIESMAVGAYCAYILFLKKEWLFKIIFSPVVKYGAALIFVWHLIFYDTFRPAQHFLLSLLYGVLILNIAANPKPLFRFENRVTAFLGNITYGIYVYHFLILMLVLHFFRVIGYNADANPLVFNLVLLGSVVGLTLLTAGLSYRYFEMPFLRLKRRFAVVESATSAEVETGDPVAAVQPSAPPA